MIEIKHLTKHFGKLTAVEDLTFSVEPGQVLGFLGPNGAGKSTTMKMVAGFLAPTSGSISVCGFDVETQAIEAKRCIGYLPEGAPCYGEMTPLQFLNFIADVRQMQGSHRSERLNAVMEQLHLRPVQHQSIDTLSKGYRRRVGLAQALIHDPDVLVLDEPTDGLDPNQKHEVRGLINDLSKDKIVIISTHILEEVEAVCDRVIIIANGRLLVDATPKELAARSTYHNAVRLVIDQFDEALEAISQLPEVARVELERDENRLVAFPHAGGTLFSTISNLARDKGWEVHELAVEQGRLDEVFRQITTADQAREVNA